ncbi:MAG: protein kinase [Deltaproteobacteria bacterium]|nr:protein kinase [Deltaproteobacteria bacterium]
MGKVYRAEQKGVGRTVAVKLMHPHLIGDETAAARFTNEARAASQLNHPHSISVIDFGQTEAGVLYIVMEFLRGRTLDQVLREEHPLALGRIAHLMCQAMEAVDAAHRIAIIHRDLKPENIFLLDGKSQLDFVKVLDFGIAKMLDIEKRGVTTPGLVPGTPEYMSPEQARGERLDPRSDVYSLAVITYELLTGSVPFRGKSAVATMMSHVQDPPVPPSARSPQRGVPAALEAIVLWGLAKLREERIPSAIHFRDVLSAWAQVAGVWPEIDPRASSPDVLLDLFSADEVHEFREQVNTADGVQVTDMHPLPVPQAPELLFGREALVERIDRFLAGERPAALRIQGAPGIGKHRLIEEVVKRGSKSLFVVRCGADDGAVPGLLGPVRRAAALLIGLELKDADASSVITAAKAVGVEEHDIPALLALFGLPSQIEQLEGEKRWRERAAAFRSLIHTVSLGKPLLLVFEDIDRYDEPSRDLICSLAAAPAGRPLLLLSHQPTHTHLWPAEMQVIDLPALSDVAAAELLTATFAGDSVPATLAFPMLEAAGGHPLFILQLAFAMRFDRLTVPPGNVADLIADRLDTLSQQQRRLLQLMAVARRPLSLAQLQKTAPTPVQAADVESLVKRGFLKSVASGFTFVHDHVAVVIDSAIPAEVRRECHQAVSAAWRDSGAPLAQVAQHAYYADDGPVAIDELRRVGQTAEREGDLAQATSSYSRALELVRREWGRGRMGATELDEIAIEVARGLADVLRRTGQGFAAEGVLEELLTVAAGHAGTRATLRLDLGRIDRENDKLERASRRLELARLDAEADGRKSLVGEVCRELSRVMGLLGQREEAGALLYESMHKLGGGNWSELLEAATIADQIGFPDRARGYLLDALAEAERRDEAVGRLATVAQMAAVHQRCGEWEEAELRLRQGIEVARKLGDRTALTRQLVELGRVRRICGDVEGARLQLQDALQVARALNWWEGIRAAQEESEMLQYAAPQAL